jgi:hypothetical protein
MAKDLLKITALCGLLVSFAEVGFCQNNWTGQVQCQLKMQGRDYVHQESQSWVITGPPVQQGAMQVYPAIWSTSVQGMKAPLNIFVRASDRRLLIGQHHAQIVAPSTCLAIDTNGPTAKLDLNSPGTLVHSDSCGGYRADHFSDQAEKHYQQMTLRFITPKVTIAKPCKATYKVVASSGGKASNATIVATNPRCGGWSGTITFQRQSEWDLAVDVGSNFERRAHSTEDADVTLNIRNNTGTSESQAKLTYKQIDYQAALRGGALTRIVQRTTDTEANAKGGSEVTLEVKLIEKTGSTQLLRVTEPLSGTPTKLSQTVTEFSLTLILRTLPTPSRIRTFPESLVRRRIQNIFKAAGANN